VEQDDLSEAILRFIREFIAGHGYPPTTLEIAVATGPMSTATAHKRLVGLRDAGRISFLPRQPRTIRILE
jgi:SOS-response transcriptional repressor LexA